MAMADKAAGRNRGAHYDHVLTSALGQVIRVQLESPDFVVFDARVRVIRRNDLFVLEDCAQKGVVYPMDQYAICALR